MSAPRAASRPLRVLAALVALAAAASAGTADYFDAFGARYYCEGQAHPVRAQRSAAQCGLF